MTTRTRVRTVLGELVLIVLGVLIALWGEGVISDSRAAAELEDQLRATREELRAADDEIGTRVAVIESEAEENKSNNPG